ncbi:hypothetical protein PHYPSEUDO_004911 [Phytophthora pseudosyringae]|uniref:WRKY19-like zinc finger domain-containing protein n=1 Tax=Phytophthora pseudosyringae TaxID=221518 RepID=A0A8T1WDB9_9STRA|nr:hypothetical protein PHYPSEUDO_004911 [Phytophthora pseudosyringae]
MSDRAVPLGSVSAASSAFLAQVRGVTDMQRSVQQLLGCSTQAPGPPTAASVENSGDRDANSSSGDAPNCSKRPQNGMEAMILVPPPRSAGKSTVTLGSGQLAASSGDSGSLSVRVSLSKARPLSVTSQEEEGGQWDRAAFMESARSATQQGGAELRAQMGSSEEYRATGRLHSMIQCDEEIDELEKERVDSLSFLDDVEEDAPRVTNSGRVCCSHPGCPKQAQTKGKCIAHGGVRGCKEPGCTATAKWRGRCTSHGGRRTCSKENCEKLALSGGKCLEHGGGGGKTCSFPNCTTRPQRRGLCAAHGGFIVCKTEGCEKRAASKGLCTRHSVVDRCKTDGCEKAGSNRGYCYKHAVESGVIKVSRKPKCKEDGCLKIQLRQGYCSRHAQERGLSVGRTCKAEGCTKVAQAGGFCGTHGGGTRCKVAGCSKSIVTKGLCSGHGGRKTCKVEGCEKWGLSAGELKGFCVEHGGGYRCKHPGCNKSVQYNGLCCTHGGKLKCEAKGCNKTVRVKGFCTAHSECDAVE